MTLTELERDALTEIFNLGVGVAADVLSQMVHEPVQLSVPSVEVTSQCQARAYYHARETRPLCAIQQTYVGEVTTVAILMFPEENSLELVRLMVGTDLSAQQLTDMEHDAMAEIGNIILNAVVSSLSTSLGLSFEGSLPEVNVLTADSLFGTGKAAPDPDNGPVLALTIDFSLSARQVGGYLAFLLDIPSGELVVQRLDYFMQQGAA